MTLTARQKRLRAAAKERRLNPRKNCPHPNKAAYKTEQAIPVALRRSKASGKALRIYPCTCGHLHLTSKPERRTDGVVQRG